MIDEKSNLKVIAISGSLRRDSYNRKALHAAKKIVIDLGVQIEEIDLKELNLPMYDGDVEQAGFPFSVEMIRQKVFSADMLLIATPEYNHSISGALKNAVDWLSTSKNVLDGKSAMIFGASTGFFGTMRAQAHLRQILTALNVMVLPQPQLFIRSAKDAFNQDGSLIDQKTNAIMQKLIINTLHTTSLIKSTNK
jgi:chromate reductase, NAD(P)H dehydrogenase (quinone)